MTVADLGGVVVGLGHPVRLMAALNVSPESFYRGSVREDAGALRDAAQQAVAEGADLIDIGAMTTAPYLEGAVSVEEERRRMAWAVEAVAGVIDVPISADTARAAVATAALAAGARIVNDVSGLRGDPAMAAAITHAAGVVLTASPGHGHDRRNALEVVREALRDSLTRAAAAGIPGDRIVIDPGIGFFTREALPPSEFNCVVLDRLASLAELGHPLLVGVSRKAFIGTITGRTAAEERLWGSLAATAIAVYNGAAVIRTHDVAATRDAIRIAAAIRDAQRSAQG